jgi:hypothetical protein
MFVSSALVVACSTSKEKQRLEMVQKKQVINIEKHRIKKLIIDSTNLNRTKLEKNPIILSHKKVKYTFGRVIDKSKTSGCSFVILTNDSVVFEPFNLGEKFKKDSLEIIFKFRKSRAMTTCMMGQTVIISEIKPVKLKN